MVENLTDYMKKISETDATTENAKTVTPIKLGKDYKEELKIVNFIPFYINNVDVTLYNLRMSPAENDGADN